MCTSTIAIKQPHKSACTEHSRRRVFRAPQKAADRRATRAVLPHRRWLGGTGGVVVEGAEDAAAGFAGGPFDLFGVFFVDGFGDDGRAAVLDAEDGPEASGKDGADGGVELRFVGAPGDDVRVAAGVAVLGRRGQQMDVSGPEMFVQLLQCETHPRVRWTQRLR